MPRPRDSSIDRAVVDACVELLGEVGRQGLTRQQIARRAGVSLPAVNRRYATVDDVLLAIAQTPGREPVADATSLREYLIRAVTHAAGEFAKPTTRRSATELLAAAAGDPRIDTAFGQTLRELRAEGLKWIDRARAGGEIADGADGGLLLDMLTGTIYYRLLWRGEAITPAEIEPLVDAVLAAARG